MNALTLQLPMPPSVNESYANRKGPGRGRVATAALRNWKSAAAKSAMVGLVGIARRPVFAGRVDVLVRVPVPANGRNRDGDNCLKATLDLLVSMGVIAGDDWRRVRRSSVEWVDGGSLGGECEVSVIRTADAIADQAQEAAAGAKRPSPLRQDPGSATGQRRASQRPSPKVASDTLVMRQLAAMGVRVHPGRVHITGGAR